jgi:alkanesulfonate monooxygenase SsuD/methylene tetrahydromethanopterin reductase-like flavin-dependent oxidoreductase (luciferase family)
VEQRARAAFEIARASRGISTKRRKAKFLAACEALITEEILDQFAIVARWDDVADRMIERYKGIASRLVIYLASHWREVDPKILERWGEVARAVRKAG